MGNLLPGQNQTCQAKVSQIIDESKIQIQRLNPFSKSENQIPYAQPLQQNVFAGTQSDQRRINGIIQMQQIKKPDIFENDDSYELDQKYWKKQIPNVVIRGHWYHRVPHGLSTFYFPGGKKAFVGYFNHGIPLYDDCLVIMEDGSYYHGGLKNFKFNGKGKFVNQNSSVMIEGQWEDGIPVGKVKQALTTQNKITEFQGQYNSNGEKTGKNCLYSVKNKQNQLTSTTLFEYKGDFQNDDFVGDSVIKTNDGKYEIKTNFNGEKIQIKDLQAQDFSFKGDLQRNFTVGHGQFRSLKKNSRVTYQGDIKNGMLHGFGSVSNQDGTTQRIYWYEGLKLKHERNFQNSKNFKQMLKKIEQTYKKAVSYTQLTKSLADQFKQQQSLESLSPKHAHQSYLFEMISRDKANNIVGAYKHSQQGSSSPLRNQKKELIIELQKGKFLYVTCLKIHLNDIET